MLACDSTTVSAIPHLPNMGRDSNLTESIKVKSNANDCDIEIGSAFEKYLVVFFFQVNSNIKNNHLCTKCFACIVFLSLIHIERNQGAEGRAY